MFMRTKMIKNVLSVLYVLFVIWHPLRAQSLTAAIAFDERVYDFGTVSEKSGKVSHTFLFRNTGKTPVVIDDIYSGCGCIGRVLSKDPVPPGGKGKLTIIFNPDYKAGFFSREILVYIDKGKQYSHIWVQGTVAPAEHPIEDDYPYAFGKGLYLRLKVMAFGYLKPGETRTMELHYANNTAKEMDLRFAPDGVAAGLRFTNPGRLKAKARGVITFSCTMPLQRHGDALFTLHPYVNRQKLAETLQVKILDESKLPVRH